MPLRNEILEYINSLLNIGDFDDYSVNGLQVEGKENVSKIILGVSSSERLFSEAINRHADMIIVHHGLFWKNDPSPYTLTGIARQRISLLLKNDINLAAYHLPLDAHPEIGNNAQIMKKLNIKIIKQITIGFLGTLNNPSPLDTFVKFINQKLETECMVFPFGSQQVSRVLIISGGAAMEFLLAVVNGADTFITGDIKESLVRAIEEVKLNLINAGHYNTEKFGIQALGYVLKKQFDIPCEFVDIPNPV